jgi:hypothetical protein
MFVNCIWTKYIKTCINQGLNSKPHGNNLNHQTTSTLYEYKWKTLTLSYLGSNCLENSNFNIHFLFQNVFKCYKWKYDLKVYSVMYSNKLL